MRATFSGGSSFGQARFSDGQADFSQAKFSYIAAFDGAEFTGTAVFLRAEFDSAASFRETKFAGQVSFDEAQFSADALFDKARTRMSIDLRKSRIGPGAHPKFQLPDELGSTSELPVIPANWDGEEDQK